LKVQPAEIIDKLVILAVNILAPPSNGSSSWFLRGLKSIEYNSEKMQQERNIRSKLQDWDQEFPFMHHELIVRYVAAFLASGTAVFVYDSFKGLLFKKRKS